MHGKLLAKDRLLRPTIEKKTLMSEKERQTALVQLTTQTKANSTEFVKEAFAESRPVACVQPQPTVEQKTEELQIGEEVKSGQMEMEQNSFQMNRLPLSGKQFFGKQTNRQPLALSHVSAEVSHSKENIVKHGNTDADVESESRDSEEHTTEGNVVLAKTSSQEDVEAATKKAKHLESLDTASQSFSCNNCGKSFETDEYLVRHIRKHLCAPFGCTNCGKLFNWLASLYRHLKQLDKCKSKETGKSGFDCKYCGDEFQDGEQLYHHMKRLTSAAKDMKDDLKEKKTKEKCDRCGYIFKNIYDLSRHINRCAGDSNFKCKKCGHPYLRRDSLLKHMKSPSCGQVLEPKARKKRPKKTLTKRTNSENTEKAWEHHGVGKNQTEMLFVSTSSRISR